MPQKPAKNMTVTVSWEPYKVLKDKAINEDTNIKTILDRMIGGHIEEGGDQVAPSKEKEKVYVCPECGEEWETKKSSGVICRSTIEG